MEPESSGGVGPAWDVFLSGCWQEIGKRYPKHLQIAVAVDGSLMSDRAASAALAFTDVRRGDKLTIMHVSDSSKGFLPKHLQPAHLRTHYEDLAIASRVNATWLCRDKTEGEGTCSSLTRLADKTGVDLLVLGSFGRKGEKLDMLGTVSDYTLRETHASICIVRATGAKLTGAAPIKFLFATDGSHAAALAFCILLKFLRHPHDKVDVSMISTTDGTKEQAVVDSYAAFMEQHKVTGRTFVKCIDRSKVTVPEGILDAVVDAGADTLVMGISGYGRKKLGSVSEHISMRAHCTTIIVKDSKEVLANRFSGASGAASLARELR